MPTQETLSTGWLLRCTAADEAAPAAVVSREVPAAVPGCVHTDLLAAGLIDDPYLDRNEETLAWIGESDWSLTTTLASSVVAHDRVDLVFEGLDTVAEVLLDDQQVLSTRNMHRTYRADITRRFTGAPQQLQVRFASPLRYARAQSERLGPLPCSYPMPFNMIRKMACNFGWDWGPSLVTSGIWKPVRLQAWSTARLARVRPHVTVTSADHDGGGEITSTGRILIDVELERAGADRPLLLRAKLSRAGAAAGPATGFEVRIEAGATTGQLELTVPDPELWWPRGHGGQPLHDLVVTLSTAQAPQPLDSWAGRIGFRTVTLDQEPDEQGRPFTFRINGKPVSIQGANWIPDDCFPNRIGAGRYRRRIEQAAEAGVNLLRVWGGGIYESDDFYAVCDELGILTWQDFLFACAAYPEDADTAAEVEAEARDNVTRLMSHPSLVLWNGNNENLWGHADWGWAEELGGRPWGMGYYTGLLPRLVAEIDPTTPYWPGSPWSGTGDLHPNDPAHGNMHIWDVWNQRDYAAYREYRPRFVSEFGFQGPATFSTLSRALHDQPLRPDSAGMLAHQKAKDGDLKLRRGLEAHFRIPRSSGNPAVDLADWHLLTQVNQARAVQLGAEHFRSLWPHCTGAIVWQLNDCWPVTSWAAIDGDGRRKPLWYGLRAAFAPRLVTVQPRGDGLVVVAVNDTDEPWSARLTARRVQVSGRELATEELLFEVAPRSVQERALGTTGTADAERHELLVVDGGPRRAIWTWAQDKDLALPNADLEAVAQFVDTVAGAGVTAGVTVTARSVLRDLCLFPDRLTPAAEVDEQLVTLLPGESRTFTVTGLDPAEDILKALTVAPVLRCVNDLPHLTGKRAGALRKKGASRPRRN